MAKLTLVLYFMFICLTFGLRPWLQRRRTGSFGIHGVSDGAAPSEWIGGVLMAIAGVCGIAAPALDLAGVLDPIGVLDGATGHVVGIALASVGVALTFLAQLAMGVSWRIGVDVAEVTELVIGGPFAIVRNPIYTAILTTALGLALMVPNALAAISLACLCAALEMQTRTVEEPYLLRTHGQAYADYGARVGRFVPRVGLLG